MTAATAHVTAAAAMIATAEPAVVTAAVVVAAAVVPAAQSADDAADDAIAARPVLVARYPVVVEPRFCAARPTTRPVHPHRHDPDGQERHQGDDYNNGGHLITDPFAALHQRRVTTPRRTAVDPDISHPVCQQRSVSSMLAATAWAC